ncbi:hypothetical protein [Aquihabitans sp. McL0605]|uniref:hypothetical protein n=1 Tax=Aquihabitans sp. McL0605 TaxID=3415671 RepID=UPI003CEE6AAE
MLGDDIPSHPLDRDHRSRRWLAVAAAAAVLAAVAIAVTVSRSPGTVTTGTTTPNSPTTTSPAMATSWERTTHLSPTWSDTTFLGDMASEWKLGMARLGQKVCWVEWRIDEPAGPPPIPPQTDDEAWAKLVQGRAAGCTKDLVETAVPVQFGYARGSETMFTTGDPQTKQILEGAVDDRITSITIHLTSGADLHLEPSPTGLFDARIDYRDRVEGIDFAGTDITVRCSGGPIDKISWANCTRTGNPSPGDAATSTSTTPDVTASTSTTTARPGG